MLDSVTEEMETKFASADDDGEADQFVLTYDSASGLERMVGDVLPRLPGVVKVRRASAKGYNRYYFGFEA